MKNQNIFLILTAAIVMLIFSSVISKAQFSKTEVASNEKITANTHQFTQNQKTLSDSLPAGVNQDWLKSLTDEKGNRIISEEDPEGDALQQKTFNGFNTGDYYGSSVASAGDVNGDGYSDVIIGAFLYSSGKGRVYIYYGGINMNTIADVILTGEITGDFFGNSVSKAGDVNGDGYADVIVGANRNNTTTGKAYIYYGGAAMNSVSDITLTGEAVGNYFGTSVSTAGDLNGDGYSDLIVGATGFSSNTGRSYIYFGGALMNNIADVTMTGEFTNNYFGSSVAEAGDVNADGFSDVIVGASGFISNTGRVYIYLGAAVMDNVTDVVMTGVTVNNYFGNSVSGAGDVNGDGYSDVIAGAYGYNSNTGKANIYFGGFLMDYTEDVTLTGEAVNNNFGYSVSGAGDVNGDGYSDVIAGANSYNSNTGRAYIFQGGISMDNITDVTFTGETTFNEFGSYVSGAGDVNGDGYSDVIVGAYRYNSNTGRAYVYTNTMSGNDIVDLTVTGESINNFFGSVSGAGDVNGDGYSDIIVGAYRYNSNTGRAYIYYGGINMNNIADVILTGESANNSFGLSVSGAGDLNGDGYSDVIVGAKDYLGSTGRAYIYYGGSSMDNFADVTMMGEAFNNYFGEVSDAGDLNGDGYSDVIVGASGYDSNRGRAYIYFGGNPMNSVIDVTLSGESFTYNYFGGNLSSAGDLNGDDYSDIIIGVQQFGSAYKGKVYIYYGGAAMNSTEDLTINGATDLENLGRSVSGGGDINGDGYSDIIVSSNISVTVYLGDASMNSVADITLTQENPASFGSSVSNTGDVNGDGYSDFIVGATGINSSTGKAYLYFGSAILNNTEDIIMTGENINNYFSYSISGAGDLNGDGFSDVIVGAYGHNSNTGKAYIYLSSPPSVKPILNYVKDVPNDQGGKVNLKWARSGYDVNGSSIITDYLVQRSFPTTGGSFSWQNISSIPASHESFYTYVDFTPSDSSSGGSGTFFYRITARTSDINQYWRSAILSGRSIDNIAPLMLSPFTATSAGINIRLNWKRSSSADLLNYILYRSTSPTIDPQTEPVFATTTDSTYLDTSPLNADYYYFAVAQDIHNNKSPVAVVAIPNFKKLFTFGAIQGLYDANTDTEIYDTVKVYLRNSTFPFVVIDSSKNLLYGPGTGQEFMFAHSQNNVPYYVVVKHRNALETWSADPVTFISGDASIAFSVSSIYAYGNNEIQVDSSPYNVFAFYSGDINQDGIIDVIDIVNIFNDANNFVSGYVNTDLTGDEFVDVTDLTIAFNNSNNFVSLIRP